MTPAEEALATVDGLGSLRLEGEELKARVLDILTGATVERTIEGASTLVLSFQDDDRDLIQSGLFESRVTTQVEKFSYELVQVRKSGHSLECTFEDLAVAALRRHKDPMKIAAHKMTHVQFARKLVAEEKWINFHVPKGTKAIKSLTPLTRGNPKTKGEDAEEESSWDALGRIAEERGWRRFIRGKNTLWYTPDTVLFDDPPQFELREYTNGVDFIDFDFDAGKPVASMDIDVRGSRWTAPVGTTVLVKGLGPANGKWMVTKISRSLFDLKATVTLEKAQPVLPEPKPAPKPKSYTSGGGAGGSSKLEDILKRAGFSGDSLKTAAAIVMAESGGDATKLGDVALEDAKWGPSVGLFQIRSLKHPEDYTGNDRLRVESKLKDALYNAKTAYKISNSGQDWGAWSTYTSGAYKQYLSNATSRSVKNYGGLPGTQSSTGTTRGGTSKEGYQWPAHGPITSGYGPRSRGFHTGTDIGVGLGTPVHASKSGTVYAAAWFGSDSYGNAVYINHPDGSQTRYAHLSAFRCHKGQWVDQGDLIALSGSTGNSTGPHLHFEILKGGHTVNPIDYLP